MTEDAAQSNKDANQGKNVTCCPPHTSLLISVIVINIVTMTFTAG